MEENFLTDKSGRKIAIQVPIKIYKKLVADSEELEEISEYRKAKTHKGDPVPCKQAFRDIEKTIK